MPPKRGGGAPRKAGTRKGQGNQSKHSRRKNEKPSAEASRGASASARSASHEQNATTPASVKRGRDHTSGQKKLPLPSTLQVFISGGRQIKTVRDGQQFVQGIASIADSNRCVDLLAEDGKARIVEILEARSLSLTAPSDSSIAECCSISTVIVPLLQVVLANEKTTSLVRQQNKLMSVLCGESDLFRKLSSALENQRRLDIHNISILTQFLMEALLKSRAREFEVNHFSALRIQLARLLNVSNASGGDAKADTLRTLSRCEQILSGRINAAEERIRAEQERQQHQTANRYFPQAREGRNVALYDGPGNTSKDGCRHSNDFAVIAEVAVIPPEDELLCERSPSLPQNRADAPHHVQDRNSIHRLLDVHFRLLRHEAHFPLISVARPLVMMCGQIVAAVQRKGSCRLDLNKLVRTEEECPSLWCFGAVKYCEVSVNHSHGVVHEFHADELQELQSKPPKFRRYSWEKGENKVLMPDDMALLLRTDQAPPRITLATVADRPAPTNTMVDKRHRLRIALRLVDCSAESTKLFADPQGQFLIFDVRAGFFSFKPILEGLQRMPMDEAAMSPVLALLALTKQPLALPTPPEYMAAKETFDLREILKPGCSERVQKWASKVARTSVLSQQNAEALIQRLLPHSRLDPGQTRAFVETLRRPLAITQGPPGTGKTHLGIALVEFLRQNSLIGESNGTSNGPLLCVCYTNHALNQFLEHIKHKFPAIKMVRIGGGSCGDELEPYLLREQWKNLGRARQRFEVGMSNRRSELKTELEELEAQSKALSRQLHDDHPTLSSLRPLLDTELPAFSAEFGAVADRISSLNRRGVEIAGATQRDILDLWLHPLRPAPAPRPCSSVTAVSRNQATTVRANRFALLDDSDEEEQEEQAVEDEEAEEPLEEEEDVETVAVTRLLRMPSRGEEVKIEGHVTYDLVRGESPWLLPLHARRAIHHLLMSEHRAMCRHMYTRQIQRMEEVQLDLQELKQAAQARFLATQDVIGATVTGMSKYSTMLCSAQPKILVLEEAAEVLEAHTLSLLYPNIQHVILIGDHKQLRPKVNVYDLQVDSGRGYDMDRSLFERLVEDRNVPTAVLATQYRMRPQFSRLIRTLYPHLEDAARTLEYPGVGGMVKNLFFWAHEEVEDNIGGGGQRQVLATGSDKSKKNRYEVKMLLALCNYLLQQGYTPERITVLTGYVGQSLELRNAFARANVAVEMSERDLDELSRRMGAGDDTPDAEDRNGRNDAVAPAPGPAAASGSGEGVNTCSLAASAIRVATIDNFQGEENDIILVSLVRSNPKNVTGFLKIANRVNVLLSRAKHGMYLVGNPATLTATDGIWREMLNLIEEDDCVGPGIQIRCQNHPQTVATCNVPSDFEHNARDGGCMRKCEFRLECGHACPLMCHPGGHDSVRCFQPCQRTPPECPHRHPCPKLCHQPCGACTHPVHGVALPCGHVATLACHQTLRPDRSMCRVPTVVSFPTCSHTLTVTCAEAEAYENGDKLCNEKCNGRLSCGHQCSAKCGECAKAVTGQRTDADTALPAAMQRLSLTSDAGTERVHIGECVETCNRLLVCGHECGERCHVFHQTTCGASPCKAKCLSGCEHSTCRKPCGEPCTPCTERCTWACPHQGACTLVCSAPCSRLPCNRRCANSLKCGHRCPGVCGEKCAVYAPFCVECATPDKLEAVVDLVEFKTLREVDLDADPLVVFPCGQHALTMSCADAHMDMRSCYEVDEATGQFVGVKSISVSSDSLAHKRLCPSGCVVHETGGTMKRYGRILKQRRAVANQLRLQRSLQPATDAIVRGVRAITDGTEARPDRLLAAAQAVVKQAMDALRVLDAFRVSEAHSMRTGSFEYAERGYLDPLPKQVKLTLEQALIMLDSCATSPVFDQIRMLPVSLSAASHHKPKLFGDFVLNRASAVLPVLFDMQALQSTIDLVKALIAPALKMLARGNGTSRERVNKLVVQPFRVLIIVIDGEYPVQMRVNACAAVLSILPALVTSEVGCWPDEESSDATTCAAVRARSIAQAKTQIVLTSALQLLDEEHGSFAAWKDVGNGVLVVLSRLWGSQHSAFVKRAGDQLQAQIQRCLQRTTSDDNLRGLLRKMEAQIAEVKNAGLSEQDLKAIVAAMGQPPESVGYNGSGHWNTCPNGHPYFIGDCGGAMVQSNCPECGAQIGGGQHRLRDDNQRVSTFGQLAGVVLH